MLSAASRPCAVAVTVRSSPAFVQSPAAQTPGSEVRSSASTAIRPWSSADSLRHAVEGLADGDQHLLGGQRDGLAGAFQSRRAVPRVFQIDGQRPRRLR